MNHLTPKQIASIVRLSGCDRSTLFRALAGLRIWPQNFRRIREAMLALHLTPPAEYDAHEGAGT